MKNRRLIFNFITFNQKSMPCEIKKIQAREILDSRGNPTVAVKVFLKDGTVGEAKVPSGASTGSHEALELRDNNPKRYGGQGVLKACRNVNEKIDGLLKGTDARQQGKIDRMMIDLDGTENKSKLGANAILGVSLASACAAAKALKLPLYKYIARLHGNKAKKFQLPIPTMNILNGGRHADWSLDFQEFMIVPLKGKFSEKVRMGAEIFHALGKILKENGYVTLKGDEGGYAPRLGSNEKAFQWIMEAIKKAGYEAGKDVALGIDAAASEFYDGKKKKYALKIEKKSLTSGQMVDFISYLVKKYPLITVEDGLAEDDWENWQVLTRKLGKKITLVGDDFFVTNVKRLRKGIEMAAANAILIKVNQIGTLSETLNAIKLAQQNGYKVNVSHRSGETADTFIADLVVGTGAEFIKTGSLSRSERVEKYNRLTEIEGEIK